jgi:N-acetylmuramoyl-L-alanine amidase
MSRYTWLLDAGHGGIINGVYQTAGKRSPRFPDGSVLYEGEFNRAIVKQIKKLARSKFCGDPNIKIIDILDGSREDIPLRQRISIANKIHKEENNCIFVSVHANAFGNGKEFNQAKGVCTFHHYKSSKGKKLAESLQKHLADITPLRDRGIRSNDTWANFYVLRKTHMPAVLSENGFMTNFDDATALLNPGVRRQIAAAHWGMIQEIEKNGL